MKTCSKCGIAKPVEDFAWTKNNNGRLRRGQCKPCVNERSRRYTRSARVNPIRRADVEDEYAWAVTILGWSHERALEWLRKACDVPMNTLEEWELKVPTEWSYVD
jgi:hypothetical protein